jgi:hypothetical protein
MYPTGFLTLKGDPNETLSAATTPEELAEWLELTGLYSDVRNDGGWVLTRSLDHAQTLRPSASIQIAMLIHAHMLSREAIVEGRIWSDEYVLRMFPNHFIVLNSNVTESQGLVTFSYWTWGSPPQSVTVARDVFEANYYGAIVARVRPRR